MFVLFPKQKYIHLRHVDVLRVQGGPGTFRAHWAYCTYADHLHSICTTRLTNLGFITHSACMLHNLPPLCAVDLS